MPEFNAAIALAQLERLDELVNLRKDSAQIFLEVIGGCKFLVPQHTPDYCINSYWALGVKFIEEEIGVSWFDFRKKYMEFGGDGIYGAWKVPYLEPVMRDRNFVSRCPEIYKNVYYESGLCPVAEKIQKQLMVFKTNYRNLDLAKNKANSLKQTIEYYTK